MLRFATILLLGALASGRYAATHSAVILPERTPALEGPVRPVAERHQVAERLVGQRTVRDVQDLLAAVHGLPAVVCGLTAEAAAGWGGRTWMNAPYPPLGPETAERVAYFPRGRLALRDVAVLLDSLATKDPCVRELAVRLLGRVDAPVVESRLIDRIGGNQARETREGAILALGLVRSPAAVDPLVRLVRDDAVGVRANATWALGRIGAKRVAPALRGALADDESLVREAAAGSLGALDDADSVDELLRVLRGDRVARVRRVAAWALGSMDERRAGSGLVAALASEQEREVREMIVWALGSLEEKTAVRALTEALRRDRDEEVRESAAWALGEIEDPSAAAALGEAAGSDTSADVRGTAAWALGQIEVRTAPDGLIDAVTDASPEVRTRAAWALSEVGDAKALTALRGALRRETAARARRAQLRALMKLGERSEQFFKELLTSEDPEVREAAVSGMAGRGMHPWPWPMPRPRPFP